MAHSAEYRRFMASLDPPAVDDRGLTVGEMAAAHDVPDTLDVDALARLQGIERAEAERTLLERIEQAGDERIPPALAAIGCTAAVEPLRRALTKYAEPYYAAMRAEAALALHRLVGEPAAQSVIAEALEHGDERGRMHAVRALSVFDNIDADRSLLSALDDEAEPVRLAAISALFLKHGWDEIAPSGRLGQLAEMMLSPVKAERVGAISELSRIVDETRAGKTPAELGLL